MAGGNPASVESLCVLSAVAMARFVDASPAPDPFLRNGYFTPNESQSGRSSAKFTPHQLAGMGRMSPVAKLIDPSASSSGHGRGQQRPDINSLVPKPGFGEKLPKWASDFREVSNYHHLRSGDVLNLNSERTQRTGDLDTGRRERELRPGAYHNLDGRTAASDRSRWGMRGGGDAERDHRAASSFRSSVDSEMSNASGLEFQGWGPRTRIIQEGEEEREHYGRRSWPVRSEGSGADRKSVV